MITDWTHKGIQISDIRKLSDFYIFTINGESPGKNVPLMVKDKIFDERLKLYFLKDVSKISRDEILQAKWNMYISKGHYIKMNKGQSIVFEMDSKKYYVSYLEIEGPLGTFDSINKDKEY